jgi:hypothetical protein
MINFEFQSTFMQENNLNDIREIRKMMERNSRFLSLSGLSGIIAGVSALVGAYFARERITSYIEIGDMSSQANHEIILDLGLLALLVLIAAISGSFYFTLRKSKKNEEAMWSGLSRQILLNLMIPILTGGIISFAFLIQGNFVWVAPIMLICYGLGCIGASHRTMQEIFGLGLSVLILGLTSLFFLGNGLLFWTLGFGVCHILYGILMHWKYDRQK